MDNFQIVLDSPPPSSVYTPGSTISGYVILVSSKMVKARQLSLRASGRGHSTFWKEKRCKTNELELYKSDETYLKSEIILWKPKSLDEKLPIGESRFPFAVEIPPECPPTFEGRNGHIRYKLKAEITVPWGFDKTAELRFLVGPMVDLVAKPSLAKKAEVIVGKNEGFPSADIRIKISIPKIAYFLDEFIDLTAEITNDSQAPVTCIESGICCITTYTAEETSQMLIKSTKSDTNTKKFQVDKTKNRNAEKRKFNLERVIPIPTLMPTISKCNIITVQYSIYVAVFTTNSSNFTSTASIPVLISNMRKNPKISIKKDDKTTPKASLAAFHGEIGKSKIKSSGALTTLVRNATKNTINTAQICLE